MIDNLDEAIKHCEEVAYEQDMKAGFETDNQTYTMSEAERERCKECASEHRQLAKLLKELEAYRNIISELSEALHFYDGCEKCQGFREYPTSDFVDDVRSWVKQFEEVNTDES